MNYPLVTSSIGGISLPMASSAPGYESHSAYSPFNPSDVVPRSYVEEPFTSAPDVLIHPPTLYNHSNQLSHNGEYRATPSASPATSVGGSGISGSEAGSARGSYSRSIGAEEHLQNFAMIDPTFSGAKVPFSHAQLGLTLPPGIDPSLVSNS
ncbi:hypothetical protein K440DRAFT_585764, partial [Wilcoxina mikolae CBS 423.85]